jgi:hypothetical protein
LLLFESIEQHRSGSGQFVIRHGRLHFDPFADYAARDELNKYLPFIVGINAKDLSSGAFLLSCHTVHLRMM